MELAVWRMQGGNSGGKAEDAWRGPLGAKRPGQRRELEAAGLAPVARSHGTAQGFLKLGLQSPQSLAGASAPKPLMGLLAAGLVSSDMTGSDDRETEHECPG